MPIFYYFTAKREITDIRDEATRPVNETPEKGSWITVEHEPFPLYNPVTQMLSPTRVETATEHRLGFTVRAKTAQELAIATKEAARTAARVGAKADTFVQNFIAMSPEEVASYVETNVTTLAEAKGLMKKLALMLLFIAKETYED